VDLAFLVRARGAASIFCVGGALTLSSFPNCAAQTDEKLVPKDQLLCVLNNLDKYLAVQNNPVIIVLAACPNAELTTEVMERLTRDELPQPKVGRNNSAGSVARFLVLTKADLNCLSNFRVALNDRGDALFRLPKNLCGSK
jgi:hypothetical protein